MIYIFTNLFVLLNLVNTCSCYSYQLYFHCYYTSIETINHLMGMQYRKCSRWWKYEQNVLEFENTQRPLAKTLCGFNESLLTSPRNAERLKKWLKLKKLWSEKSIWHWFECAHQSESPSSPLTQCSNMGQPMKLLLHSLFPNLKSRKWNDLPKNICLPRRISAEIAVLK